MNNSLTWLQQSIQILDFANKQNEKTKVLI